MVDDHTTAHQQIGGKHEGHIASDTDEHPNSLHPSRGNVRIHRQAQHDDELDVYGDVLQRISGDDGHQRFEPPHGERPAQHAHHHGNASAVVEREAHDGKRKRAVPPRCDASVERRQRTCRERKRQQSPRRAGAPAPKENQYAEQQSHREVDRSERIHDEGIHLPTFLLAVSAAYDAMWRAVIDRRRRGNARASA